MNPLVMTRIAHWSRTSLTSNPIALLAWHRTIRIDVSCPHQSQSLKNIAFAASFHRYQNNEESPGFIPTQLRVNILCIRCVEFGQKPRTSFAGWRVH
jgi:hypothetical protein